MLRRQPFRPAVKLDSRAFGDVTLEQKAGRVRPFVFLRGGAAPANDRYFAAAAM
jgi:hypothetical protein